jgi:putative hydrolase of the HAD superfamily
MADLKHKRHVFFDFDDTLWDFRTNSERVLKDLFTEYGLEQKLGAGEEAFLEVFHTTNLRFWSLYHRKEISKEYLRNHRFHETFRSFGYDHYEENLRVTEQYLKRAPYGSALKEGCREVLEYLGPHYRLHIITNGFREVFDMKMEACGIRHFFDQVIVSEDYELTKPDERVFRLAEELAGAGRHDCVMIGDSLESDVQGALNAGWEAIYLSPDGSGEGHAGHTITRLEELKTWF